jgi:anti-sigma factor RsiW
MNSSEPLQPLTPHEEKLTAYLDGSLPPEDAAAFEQANPDVLEMRRQHRLLSAALRTHSPASQLRNGEFFNHQILREIQPAPAPAAARPAIPFWRLLFASAACGLAVFAIVMFTTKDPSKSPGPTIARNDTPGTYAAPKYVAKVTEVTAGDYLLTAKLLPPDQSDGLAVVWVDGMEKLSKDYVLQ